MRPVIHSTLLLLAFLACAGPLRAQEPDEDAAQQAEFEQKAQRQLEAREALDAGITELQAGKYQHAIAYFKNAVFLDENLTAARVQMAMAYARQYRPGDNSDDNLRMAREAISQFKAALQQDPRNLESLKGVARLYTETGDLDPAVEYYKQLIEISSDDPEPYYFVGMIDWTMVYADTGQRKAAAGLKVDDPYDGAENERLCKVIAEANGVRVQEGLEMLQAAIKRRPQYYDAFAYLALMYRRAADLSCGDAAARSRNLKLSEEWADRALASRQTQTESGGKQKATPARKPK